MRNVASYRSYPQVLRQMRDVAISLKSSTNEECIYLPQAIVALKSSTNEERSYQPQVFDK